MRILLINQTFHPDVAATAQHCHDLARDLVQHGHQVTVVASRSLYGQRGAPLPRRETVDGADVRRVGWSLFGKAGFLARSVDFALFYVAAAWRSLTLPRHDVSICLTTPPFIALVGVLLRAIKGTRTVYWVMDLYPDVAVGCGIMRRGSAAERVLEAVNRFCLRAADAVVVLGRCVAARVAAKGVAPARLTRIGPWTDGDEVQPVPRDANPFRLQWEVGDRVLVMYSGNFGLGHDVDTFLAAARELREDDRIRFAFVGGGKRQPEVAAFVDRHGLEGTCAVAPYQPRAVLDELLSAADVHLVTMREGVEGTIVPSKLFGVMAAGRPAVFVGNPVSEIGRIVTETAGGISVRPGDVSGLVAALRRYSADPDLRAAAGDRARAALVTEHGAKHRLADWRALLESVAGPGGPDAG